MLQPLFRIFVETKVWYCLTADKGQGQVRSSGSVSASLKDLGILPMLRYYY